MEYNFVSNEIAVLNCLVTGTPAPEITWLRLGEQILPTYRYRIFKSKFY